VDEESIFAAALVKASPADRLAFLAEACRGDSGLRGRVEALLQAHENPDQFLEPRSAAPVLTLDEQPAGERPGAVIGPYKLLEQIGEGGFGVVFLAEQAQPVRRRVALKVIKPGMDTRAVIARFEAERQALALMDHPHIAKVLDGGETASGRPYFVMELVKGAPITQFCDGNRLTPRERLELFIPVCSAVQHAHQKGIIHRDLKPSNILATLHDGVPVVKVIDFGVAKAVGQQLTDKTVYTQLSQLVGTPLYMSPEQAGQSGLDVDTRSDIYALGVLLYELLTGTTPFDPERLRTAGYGEMLRIIREEEPPRPSTRFSTLGPAATVLSVNRKSDAKRLSQLCRGELDWIVMKCLEKDRNRRYETAAGLARDIGRYLHDEPVQACPPSAWYRGRKFARRHRMRLAVAGCACLFLALLVGGVGWTMHQQTLRRTETARAVPAALAQVETLLSEGDKQMDNPSRWLATVGLAESAVQRAEGLLALGEATGDLTLEVRRIREAVDAARTESRVLAELERIELETTAVKDGHFDQPRAAPRYAAVLRDYGVDPATPEEAAARLRRSRLREALLAALEEWARVTPDAAEQRRLEAVLHAAEPAPDAFRTRWRAAVRRQDGAALAQLAGEPDVQGLPAAAVVKLARDLRSVNEWATAERLLRTWQERYRGHFWLNHDLGMVLLGQTPPRPDEAVPYLTAALALRSDSPGVYLNLGQALSGKKDLDGAIRTYQAALQIDPNYAEAHHSLGVVLFDRKDLDGAIREYQAALRIKPNYIGSHYGLGNAFYAKKDLAGAIREYQAALKINPSHAQAHHNLGVVLFDKKDLDGAIREFQAALTIDPRFAQAHNHLGTVLVVKKDLDGAIRAYQAALQIDPNYAEAHCNLGYALVGQARFTDGLVALKTGHKLGSLRADWPNRFAEAVRRTERYVQLDAKLSKLLNGDGQPADAGECIELARICLHPYRQLEVAATRFFREAFAAQPTLAEDLRGGHRYDAACVAALAGCGQGKDAGKLDPQERAGLRRQARDWLQADLTAWRQLLEEDLNTASPTVWKKMQHWQRDADLAGVRGEALSRLPEAERRAWQQLWDDVQALARRTADPRK
jgi:serine/threonine protein kinase/tetratricopeptide (TPR) repeat protein